MSSINGTSHPPSKASTEQSNNNFDEQSLCELEDEDHLTNNLSRATLALSNAANWDQVNEAPIVDSTTNSTPVDEDLPNLTLGNTNLSRSNSKNEYFALRDGALERAAETCKPTLLDKDGDLVGFWLLTE